MSSEAPPPSVTVKLKRGTWEIEITSPTDKVQQAIESVLAGMASKEELSLVSSDSEGAGEGGNASERKFETCRSVLQAMWKQEWFSNPRTLSEVHEEMARRGYHYDRTAVSHTLVDLVREGVLFRDGTMRNYRYVQKFPSKPQGAAAEV